MISAGVMHANVIWNVMKRYSGITRRWRMSQRGFADTPFKNIFEAAHVGVEVAAVGEGHAYP